MKNRLIKVIKKTLFGSYKYYTNNKNVRSGSYKDFFIDENKDWEGYFFDGMWNGIFNAYVKKNLKTYIHTYKNNIINGITISFYHEK